MQRLEDRKATLANIRTIAIMTFSLLTSWAFAATAIWGLGPFSWPSNQPQPTIAADDITVSAAPASADQPQTSGGSVAASAASVSR